MDKQSMKANLHCNSFEDRILLNKLNVINSQTHEEVHDDDGHGDDEHDKEGLGGVHVGDSDEVLVIVLVVKKQVVILHLPAGHDQGLDDGKHQVAEILLVAQQHEEAQTEGENEEQNNHRDFHEGIAHVNEHYNINAKEGHLPEEKIPYNIYIIWTLIDASDLSRDRRLSQVTVRVNAPSSHCQGLLSPVSTLQLSMSTTTRMADT